MLPVIFTLVLALVHVSPALAASIEPRYSTLADGSFFDSGALSPTFRWQSSGVLAIGGCNSRTASIKSCYSMYLTGSLANGTGTMLESTAAPAPHSRKRDSTGVDSPAAAVAAADDLDLDSYFEAFPEQRPSLHKRQLFRQCGGGGSGNTTNGTTTPPIKVPSPRQRIELFSWPGAMYDTTWQYQWRTYLAKNVSTDGHFFHMFQILRRDACGGPVVTLDAINGQAVITDLVRGCTKGTCPSVPISKFWGKTIQHSMKIKYGLNGTMQYLASDVAAPGVPIIAYNAVGDMGSSASLKFGMYRFAANTSAARSFVGDYSAKRLS